MRYLPLQELVSFKRSSNFYDLRQRKKETSFNFMNKPKHWVGTYYSKSHYPAQHASDELTQTILRNKHETNGNTPAQYISKLMHEYLTEKNLGPFDCIIPVANHKQNFEQIISGDYGHLVSGDSGIGIWTNYPGFTIYYPDITNSNMNISLDFPGDGYLWIAPLMENPDSPGKAILGGGGVSGGNHLIELTRLGNQIIYDEQEYNFSNTISAMGYSPINSSYRYVLTQNGKFYHSSDSGNNWTITSSFTGPDGHYFYGSTIWASQYQLGRVFIGGSGYSNSPVYVSENHGQTFINMNNGLPNTLVFELSGTPDDNILFAATEVGPYAYSSYDDEWFLISGLSAPDQTYWTVDYISDINTARFGTYGRGIWDFILNDNYDIILGDVNSDNNINIQDVIIVISFILGNDNPNDNQIIASDINQDNTINVLDIVLIVDLIFGGN